jgi:hypothetical protein
MPLSQLKYYYFRDHASEGGWGVKYGEQGKIIAKCFDKNYACVIADALNNYSDQDKLLAEIESDEF